MKNSGIGFLLLASSEHFINANGQVSNPETFLGIPVDNIDIGYNRAPFNGMLPDPPDTCGLTCRGADVYPFGLAACLRTAFEVNEVMPRVNISDTGDQELPKVVFGPSTSMNADEFNLNEYNLARASFKSRLPVAVLYAETTDDVVTGVNCARLNGYKVSPRGRNHDWSSLSTLDGTLVIDMQLNCKMENFVADKESSGEHILPGSRYIGKLRVPSGCTNAVFLAAMHKEFGQDGGMSVIGTCPSVGVTGFLLNGGFGDATPYAGVAADIVDEFEMVLYNGTVITASATENEDAFWASKGGTGGIGVITSFLARVVQNPSESKKFTYVVWDSVTWNDKEQPDKLLDALMKWQEFMYDNPMGARYGGGGNVDLTDGGHNYRTSGLFLGSIDELTEVFSNAGLLEEEIMGVFPPSIAGREGIPLCSGEACKEEFGENFPSFGLVAIEFDSLAEAQLLYTCNRWLTNSEVILATALPQRFSNPNIGITASPARNSDPNSTPYFPACESLGIPQENCSNETGLMIMERCPTKAVIDGILKHAAKPQSFLNRHGPAEETRSNIDESYLGYPDTTFIAFGAYGGIGTGGSMLPKLQRDTFRTLLETQNPKWNVNHFVHGAPLAVDSKATGYPHRDRGYNMPDISRQPEWIDIVLQDTAFNGDVRKLRAYGNYQPSLQVPEYETLVFGDNADELARIRTEYDPLGGFDSPRYPQRNRRESSSSPASSVACSGKVVPILHMLSSAVLVALAMKL